MSISDTPISSARRVIYITKQGKTSTYLVTDEDYTTLLRAVEREGPPKLGVAWALIQRFAALYPLYKSLSKFVQAYAQPINPEWFPQGKRHLAEVRRLGGDLKAVAHENAQALLRAKWAVAPVAAISYDTRNVVASVFEGALSPVPGATHYHAPQVPRSAGEPAARASRHEFATKRGYFVVETSSPILTSNWFYGEPGFNGIVVRALMASLTGLVVFALMVAATYQGLKHFG